MKTCEDGTDDAPLCRTGGSTEVCCFSGSVWNATTSLCETCPVGTDDCFWTFPSTITHGTCSAGYSAVSG